MGGRFHGDDLEVYCQGCRLFMQLRQQYSNRPKGPEVRLPWFPARVSGQRGNRRRAIRHLGRVRAWVISVDILGQDPVRLLPPAGLLHQHSSQHGDPAGEYRRFGVQVCTV